MLGSDQRWSGAIRGGVERSEVEGSDLRWRGEIAVIGERSKGSDLRWRRAISGVGKCGQAGLVSASGRLSQPGPSVSRISGHSRRELESVQAPSQAAWLTLGSPEPAQAFSVSAGSFSGRLSDSESGPYPRSPQANAGHLHVSGVLGPLAAYALHHRAARVTASPGGPLSHGLGPQWPGLRVASVLWSHCRPCLECPGSSQALPRLA